MIIFGQHDEKTLTQFRDVSSRAVDAALMADGHMGYCMPIGGVAAYDNKVSVVGVGFDIACGNCAIKTDLTIEKLFDISLDEMFSNPYRFYSNGYSNQLANDIYNELSFGIGRINESDDAPVDHELFHDDAWWIIPNIGSFRDDLMDKARRQLGTIGSGNHYVDVFVDTNDGHIWVGVHFGSRGLGHTIASNFLAISQGGTWGDKGKEEEVLLYLNSEVGCDYFYLMELAGNYAYVGREWVANKVVRMMGGSNTDMVHNHHNFAWKEVHNDQELVVIRKGATPAFPGQRGFVGGSMGDNAVIIRGTTEEDSHQYMSWHDDIVTMQKQALFSTVHGAGRVMSRTDAKGKKTKSGVVKKEGRIKQPEMDNWLHEMGVIRRGGDLDEAPQAYRRLSNVLQNQQETVTILNTLRPLIVCMAPAKLRDPYGD